MNVPDGLRRRSRDDGVGIERLRFLTFPVLPQTGESEWLARVDEIQLFLARYRLPFIYPSAGTKQIAVVNLKRELLLNF